MVSHDKRSSKVEFLPGDAEDREKVLVPLVDVYCYYRWDDCSFNFTCTIRVANEWVRLGCDLSLVVSDVLKFYCGQILYEKFSPRVSASCHILFPVCALYPRLLVYIVSFFFFDYRLC